MKNFKKISTLFILGLVALSTAFVSCSDDDDKDRLTFSTPKVEVQKDKTTSVTVSGGIEPYTAVLADKDLATVVVEKNVIKVTGVKEGLTVMTVKDGNHKTGTIPVSINNGTGIDFDKSDVNVKVEEESVVTIIGGSAPYTATAQDAKIASVVIKDNKATIKGLKAGATTITVTGVDRMNYGVIAVTVK